MDLQHRLSQESQFVYAPGTRSWERWNGEGSPIPEEESVSGEQPGCYCFESERATSVPLWVNSFQPAEIQEFIEIELEKSHLSGSFDYRVIDQDGVRRQIEVSVLQPDVLEPEHPGNWTHFDVGVRSCELPDDRIVFFRELGNWVAAFSKGSKLAYYHPLGTPNLDEDALGEVNCARLVLQDRQFINPLEGVVFWDDEVTAEIRELLKTDFNLNVETAPRNPPRLAQITNSKLVPAGIAAQRQAAANRLKWIKAGLAVLVIYALVLAAMLINLELKHHANRELETRIAELSPKAEKIRKIRDRWDLFALALDPDRYPLERFHRVAAPMPQGTRLTFFQIQGDDILLRGEANSSTLALRYREQLVTNPGLSDYRWEAPQPEILPDNRARFQASGTYLLTAP